MGRLRVTMPTCFADRASLLMNEGAYTVLAQATALEAEGRDIVHLEIGQPDVPTPASIVEAGVTALETGLTKYTAPAGTNELRAAIAEYTIRTRGLESGAVGPEQVIVGPGCKPGIFMTILALVNPGDEVICPDPGFPSYKNAIQVAGGSTVHVPLTAEGDAFDEPALRNAFSPQTKLIIVNSPGNPTGGTMTLDHLRMISELAIEHDCWILSDEIYSRLVYESDCAPSMLSVTEARSRLIVADGASKTFCMTGWRLGWCIMPPELAEKVGLLVVHSFGCTASFTQSATIAALQPELDVHVKAMVDDYRKRRDLVVSRLNQINGVRCPKPAGAFYAFFDISAFGIPSAELAARILKEGGCAVLPGSDFGEASEGYIRISYVSPIEKIEQGIDRISQVLSALPLQQQ